MRRDAAGAMPRSEAPVGILIAGLVLFLGTHSLRVLAPGWRERRIERLGPLRWKSLYALVSLAGLALVVWGFERAGAAPLLYAPGPMLRHLNAFFTLAAFVLASAAYVPRNRLKAWVGHPLLAGVCLWALGHLLATGRARDAALFGAFFLWSAADFMASRRRDRRQGVAHPRGSASGDILTVAIGAIAWTVFAFWLHQRLFGVSPFA